MNNLKLDEQSFNDFKEAYSKAVANKQSEFAFQNHQVATSYAKYVIEYTEDKLKENKWDVKN